MATAAAAAKHLFISASRFRDLVCAGTITHQPSGRYVLDTVREQYIRHAQLIMQGRGADGGAALSTQRAKLAEAQTAAAEIKNAVARGDYVSLTAVNRALVATFTVMREVALCLPGKCADALQPYTPKNRGEIADLLHIEVCEMLENLSVTEVTSTRGKPRACGGSEIVARA